jgi:carbon monoxide dehydrogenase subunit G
VARFELSRSTSVAAPADRVHALLDDFRQWQRWSPWEQLDPALRRTFTGPERGVGSHYAWSGNRKAGRGTMEVVESTPTSVVVDLHFLKPFEARNTTRFDLTPVGAGTTVVWTMTGERGPLMSLMGRAFFDRAIGEDFDRGLEQLRAAAETPV